MAFTAEALRALERLMGRTRLSRSRLICDAVIAYEAMSRRAA